MKYGTCETCAAWRGGKVGNSRECFRHPPQIVFDTSCNEKCEHRPDMEAQDGCFDWLDPDVDYDKPMMTNTRGC